MYTCLGLVSHGVEITKTTPREVLKVALWHSATRPTRHMPCHKLSTRTHASLAGFCILPLGSAEAFWKVQKIQEWPVYEVSADSIRARHRFAIHSARTPPLRAPYVSFGICPDRAIADPRIFGLDFNSFFGFSPVCRLHDCVHIHLAFSGLAFSVLAAILSSSRTCLRRACSIILPAQSDVLRA